MIINELKAKYKLPLTQQRVNIVYIIFIIHVNHNFYFVIQQYDSFCPEYVWILWEAEIYMLEEICKFQHKQVNHQHGIKHVFNQL